MHLVNIITTVLAVSSTVSAVTIRNFRAGTCKGNYLQCSSIPAQRCCDLANNRVYSSSKFLGLPTTAIGAICAAKSGRNCGVVKKSGHGLSLCLGNGNSKGSYWFDCRSCSKARDFNLAARGEIDVRALGDDPLDVVEESTPDIVGFGDHQFRIDSSTPAAAVDALLSLWDADTDYSAILPELKQYELATPIGDEE